MDFLGLDGMELDGDLRKGVMVDRLRFFFVGRTPLQEWVGCPLRDSTEEGQYLAALERVRPGNEEHLTSWVAEIQVEFTGKP